jgi:hypothetical protein
MDTIKVFYFHGTKFPNMKYEHGATFPLTTKRRNKIVDDVLKAGYNVMLYQTSEWLLIWIDDKRFQQR